MSGFVHAFSYIFFSFRSFVTRISKRMITKSGDAQRESDLFITITISEKRRIAKWWKKKKIYIKRLTQES